MVQNVNPTFVKTPNAQVTQITTGVGANFAPVTLYTGGANGSKIVSCLITANTSQTQDVRLSVVSSLNTGYLTAVSVSSQAGFVSSVSPVSGLSIAALPIDSDGNSYLLLPSSNWTLVAQATTTSSTWTTTSFISFTVTSGDF